MDMLGRIMQAVSLLAVLALAASYKLVERDGGERWPEELVPIEEDAAEVMEWTEVMVLAVTQGDVDAGYLAQDHLRDVTYDDAQLLSRFMEAVAREGWAPSWKKAAGEVVLNRVASTEFPGSTVREVLFPTDGTATLAAVRDPDWDAITPEAKTVRMAIELLRGERVLKDPQIVYIGRTARSNGYAWPPMVDHEDGVTYLCRTSRPELYQ